MDREVQVALVSSNLKGDFDVAEANAKHQVDRSTFTTRLNVDIWVDDWTTITTRLSPCSVLGRFIRHRF